MNNQLKAKIRKEALKRFEESNRQCDAFQLGAEWMIDELMKSAAAMRAKQKAVRELCSDKENKGILDRIQERNEAEKGFDELIGME